ncbi:unnamed protein product, partial [Prorocentrum cordatum]
LRLAWRTLLSHRCPRDRPPSGGGAGALFWLPLMGRLRVAAGGAAGAGAQRSGPASKRARRGARRRREAADAEPDQGAEPRGRRGRTPNSNWAYGGAAAQDPADDLFAPGTPPERVMEQALAEGWAPGALTRPQACLLLGLLPWSSPEDVSAAKRRIVAKVHPDRNPGKPGAEQALRLALAAADLLR